MRVSAKLARSCALGLVAVLAAGCGGGGPDVFDSVGPAADRQLEAPQYAADVPGGLLVRRPHTTDQPGRDAAARPGPDVYDEEDQENPDYGFFRVQGDHVTKVLHRKRIIDVWVSDDGRALVGLQQVKGDPCGGCMLSQQVVEIDPATGTIARTYGVPDDYDKTWRVERIDEEGDRVAVQYVHVPVSSADPREIGTFSYADGHRSKVPGSARVLTWWQGHDDRIEARLTGRSVAHARIYWVHDGHATRVPGDLSQDHGFATPSIPGGLLRPTGS